jgi:hypothetical protein
MKNIFLAAISLFTFQFLNAQTSAEEYAYLKNGYKVQVVEQGGDLKKGYELRDITAATINLGSSSTDTRKGWLKGFYKIDEYNNKKLVAYLVTYQFNNNPIEFYCIPHPLSSNTIISLYINHLYDGNEKVNHSYKLQLINLLLSKGLKW